MFCGLSPVSEKPFDAFAVVEVYSGLKERQPDAAFCINLSWIIVEEFLMLKKLVLCCLFAGLACCLFAAEPESVYISATNVRIRATPSTAAPVVATLKLGTSGKIAAKTPEKFDLLGKNDHWYQITTDEKQTGWVFGGLVVLYNEPERFQKAIELLNSRLKIEDIKVEDAAQAYEFARKMKELAPHSPDKARLELAFLKAIDASVNSLMLTEKDTGPGKKIIEANPGLVYQHECAGRCFVKPESYWQLSEKYADLPEMADEIAWEATKQPQQGETEGDPDMVLAFFEESTAVYIEKFPSGRYIGEAFAQGSEMFKFITDTLTADYFAADAERQKFIARLEKLEKSARQAPTSPARESYINNLAAVCARASN